MLDALSRKARNALALGSIATHKLRHEGPAALMLHAATKLRELCRVGGKSAGSRFDQEYGVETEAIVPLWKLRIDSQFLHEGRRYQAMDPESVHAFIRSLPIPLNEFVYIDLGSGKGRTLLIASDYPFKSIIGVEFSKELHEIAVNNIRRYKGGNQQCTDVTSVHADAASYEFPENKLVILLYNSFGEPVLRRVLNNLALSLGRNDREVYFVYWNPSLARLLDGSGIFSRIAVDLPAAIYKHIPNNS